MKKILPILIAVSGLFFSFKGNTQTFTTPSDTVIAPFVGGYASLHNNIKNITGNNLTIRWNVKQCNFPADWLTASAFGICDNALCRGNTSNSLWNPGTSSGGFFNSTYASNATHDSIGSYYLVLDLASATTLGQYYVTITLTDIGTGGTTKDITFVVNKVPVGVQPGVSSTVSDVLMYPNPAHNELNVVYDASADVKNIAVYNIIGKLVTIYRVSGGSANLNLESVPSGVYFVRLLNSQGSVVLTRKFTKQ